MARRSYSGAAPATTLVGEISNAATAFSVTDATGYPLADFFIKVDRGKVSEETMLVGSRSGNTFSSVQRGQDGTVASAHDTAASVVHGGTATDLDEANAHVTGAGTSHTGLVSKAGGDTITASAPGVIPLVVKGAAGQTANLVEFRNDVDAILSRISQGGIVVEQGLIRVTNAVAGAVALAVKGAVAQTANIFEVQNSAGVVLIAVQPDGVLNFVTAQTTTAAVAGAAALPANPVGFLSVIIAGVVRKLPYYAS